MGNVNRWLKYAKAKLDDTLKVGNDKLEKLEERQSREAHDRPWLTADDEAPTLEEARARIRWETEQAEREARERVAEADRDRDAAVGAAEDARRSDGPTWAPNADSRSKPADAPAAPGLSKDAGPAKDASPAEPAAPAHDPRLDPILPATAEEAAARSAARIELDQRDREAARRLEDIRKELGVDPPADPSGPKER